MRIMQSLASKLVLSYLLIILASFGAVAVFLESGLEQNALQEIKSSLVTQAGLVAEQVVPQSIMNEDSPALEALVMKLKARMHGRITIVSGRGKVLADSDERLEQVSGMESHADRPEIRTALAGGTGIETRYSLTLKEKMLYVALPLRDRGRVIGAVRLALPLVQVEQMLGTTRKAVVAGVLVALVLALVLGVLFIIRTVRPVRHMIQVARKFTDGDHSRRVIPATQDEIGELGAVFNAMAQHIEDKISEVNARSEQLAAMFHSMVEGVVVTDKDGRVLAVNPAVERMFGITGPDAAGRPFLEVVRNNDMARVIDSVLRQGRPVSREIALLLPVQKTCQVNAAPIPGGGTVKGCLVVIHDITELKRLETVRSDFVANVSHELKTPLTSIKGFVETLQNGALEDPKHNREFLRIISDHAERLNSLVDDLLSLAQLESKELVLHKERTDLRQLAEKAAGNARFQREKKGLVVSNEVTEGLLVVADRDRLAQVLANLVDNAIKFNRDKGQVIIRSQDLGAQVKVIVEDTGIGIPEKDLARIFERFYRVDKARSREMGGTGLGLSIVKHIIEQHQGTVGVDSVEGSGSRFWFILPKA